MILCHLCVLEVHVYSTCVNSGYHTLSPIFSNGPGNEAIVPVETPLSLSLGKSQSLLHGERFLDPDVYSHKSVATVLTNYNFHFVAFHFSFCFRVSSSSVWRGETCCWRGPGEWRGGGLLRRACFTAGKCDRLGSLVFVSRLQEVNVIDSHKLGLCLRGPGVTYCVTLCVFSIDYPYRLLE